MEQIILNITHTVIEFGFEHQLLVMTLLGGVVPTLIWLLFWLREDECYEMPDKNNNITYICESKPRSLLFVTFLCGALSVVIVLLIQKITQPFFSGLELIVVWAAIEEVLKYSVYWLIDAHSKDMQGPADPLVFLSVTALGFSAAENSLFLYQALTAGDVTNAVIGQGYRFLGASILHVLCSGFIGICIGYSFFAGYLSKRIALLFGLFSAIALHSLFNYLIIMDTGGGLGVPAIIWGIGIVFLLLIEGLHYLAIQHKKSLQENNI
jgi:RsiW-degrading membrane proteinase PrsW (M82 family)